MSRNKGPFYKGKVHVNKKMCNTCIFRPGNLMHLEPGRVASMVEGAVRNQSCIPCHKTLDGNQAVCRGFFNRHKTLPLILAEAMGVIQYTDIPKEDL